MKLTTAQKRLLFEAYRRSKMAADSFESGRPLNERWLGLGTEAAYRPVIDAGLMRFFDGRTPYRRCMGWLVLTDAGVAALQENEVEFAAVLEYANHHGYQSSYAAHYMLMGGIAAD